MAGCLGHKIAEVCSGVFLGHPVYTYMPRTFIHPTNISRALNFKMFWGGPYIPSAVCTPAACAPGGKQALIRFVPSPILRPGSAKVQESKLEHCSNNQTQTLSPMFSHFYFVLEGIVYQGCPFGIEVDLPFGNAGGAYGWPWVRMVVTLVLVICTSFCNFFPW